MRCLKFLFIAFLVVFIGSSMSASRLLIPMDKEQKNHLKSYGIAYWVIDKNLQVEWLLNYRGGSFALPFSETIEKECIIRGVSYEIVSESDYSSIVENISRNDVNQEVIKLEVAPKIAIYSPKTKLPWDDAVTMVLTYAEIPYEVIYDQEILTDKLPKYNWLHLHHEDFTGQYGKFYGAYHTAEWYKKDQENMEAIAKEFGFDKVSKMKLAVTKRIKEFVIGGGFLFAMCSATDSYDIALASEETDICESVFDGDPLDPNYQNKLDFNKSFAFQKYNLYTNPYVYEYSSIDRNPAMGDPNIDESEDYFLLFEFSAKWDHIPTILTQNHERIIKGFMGQTTAFKKDLIKNDVIILADNKSANEARYIHGTKGKGMWTFYGGHDPEDYQHYVYDPKTDLNLHPNSPGYRLILNNVLFPAAKKKKQKT
ncbi:MAG: hypothetical protein JNL75_04650 [Chitinophagales bacterium]|nr:hypothetical protein [Chitinophagales bacterium]